ncbi:hypothetical protein DFH07DRAFT_1035512 [Mycena maculata]|uniref:F-box domain-containing protein n=1 Tax=Mycena maculata TaxID=230809 RepID=A0AAD7IR59_9AGAR|nr:hypothetical protein DFH07DRAFT_1035512 [Mycena maculata]
MSIIEDLARLLVISTEIDMQRAVLKKSENDRRLVQRQLNDVRDPVSRLPFQISSQIFIQCLPPVPHPRAHNAPILLPPVCNTWTDIALSTPALWAEIVVFSRAEGFKEFWQTWLQRARYHPLSIFLHRPFGDQIQKLELHYLSEAGNDGVIPDFLGGLGPLSHLESLSVFLDSGGNMLFPWTYVHIVEALRRLAPTLVECTLHRLLLNASDPPRHLVLPRLRQLSFGDRRDGEEFGSDDRILKYLSLPNVRTLTLSPRPHITVADLCAFLERSSPPLQELIITDRWPPLRLDTCLRLVPTLTRLELWDPRIDLLEKLFADLAEYPSDFLPALRSLCIPRHSVYEPPWETIYHALSVRRTQVTHFQATQTQSIYSAATNGRSWVPEPRPHLRVAFRELVADGMELNIGTEVLDFLLLD